MRRGSEEAAEFVAARWPELAATARLVTGERRAATEASAAALAAVVVHWRSPDLAPGAAARDGLIRRLAERTEPGAGPDPGPPSPPLDALGGPEDGVATALRTAYAALPVTARLAIALDHVEGLGAPEVAAALDRDVDETTAAVVEARRHLAEVRDAAVISSGTRPPGHPAEADVAAMLDGILREDPDVPAPGRLVARRVGRTRRRRTESSLAVIAVLAAAVVGALLLTSAPAPQPPARPVVLPSAPATDAAWATVQTWPARGELTTDPTVLRTAGGQWGPGSHLLFAGTVGTSRIVVGYDSGRLATPQRIDVLVAGAGADLAAARTHSYSVTGPPQGLAVRGAATSTGVPLLVLARPTTRIAETSTHVALAAGGEPSRSWVAAPLVGGVGRIELAATPSAGQPLLPALRVRLAGYDGPPVNEDIPAQQMPVPTCPDCSDEAWAARTSAAAVARIAAATGLEESEIRTQQIALGTLVSTAIHGPTGGRAVAAPAESRTTEVPGAPTATGVLACALYRLPSGAVLASSAIRVRSGTLTTSWGGELSAVRSGDPERRPCLQLVSVDARGVVTYLAAAPGAATVQLSPASPMTTLPAGPRLRAGERVVEIEARPDLVPTQRVLTTRNAEGEVIDIWPFNDLVRWVDPFEVAPPSSGLI